MTNRRRALITGISGQDGSYLSELLLEKGYEVHGLVRRVAIEDPQHRLSRIQHLRDRIHLHAASLESYPSLMKVVAAVQPDEVYHLAAQSYVSYSFEDEFSTFEINVNGTHYLLSTCRDVVPKARFYFAGSSEMFGSRPLRKTRTPRFVRARPMASQKSPAIISRATIAKPTACTPPAACYTTTNPRAEAWSS